MQVPVQVQAQDPGAGQEVVLAGRRYLLLPIEDPPAPSNWPPDLGDAGQPCLAADPLTPREREIASLVSDGRVNKEIAARLGISEWTVSTHMRRIFAKLGVDRRAAMVSRLRTLAAAQDSS